MKHSCNVHANDQERGKVVTVNGAERIVENIHVSKTKEFERV